MDIDHAGEQIQINLWDTAGQEAYERLRLLIYPRVSAPQPTTQSSRPN